MNWYLIVAHRLFIGSFTPGPFSYSKIIFYNYNRVMQSFPKCSILRLRAVMTVLMGNSSGLNYERVIESLTKREKRPNNASKYKSNLISLSCLISCTLQTKIVTRLRLACLSFEHLQINSTVVNHYI